MPLTDLTDFTGEIFIPNLDKPEVEEDFRSFQTKYEDKFLREVMGYGLYKAYKAGLSTDPILPKWIDVRDGVDYTLNTYSYEWVGLKKPAANYIYYWYMRNKATESTWIGEVINKAENATRVSNAPKMIRAWGEMVEQVWSFVQFIDTNIATYPEWSWYIDTYVNIYYWKSYNYARLKDIFYPINAMNL